MVGVVVEIVVDVFAGTVNANLAGIALFVVDRGVMTDTAPTATAVAPLTVAATTLPTLAATALPLTPSVLDPSITVRVIVESGPLPAWK